MYTGIVTYSGFDPSTGETMTIAGIDPDYCRTFTIENVNTSTHTFTYSLGTTDPGVSGSGAGTTVTLDDLTLDEAIGRVDGLEEATGSDAGTILASYQCLGLNQMVQETQGNGDTLSYLAQPDDGDVLPEGTATSGGDQYTGLDRFGRVVDQNWFNASGGTLSRIQYAYDADGNVTVENNLVDASLSKVLGYDSIDRMTNYEEGTLATGDSSIATPTLSESWELDALGNFISVTTGSTTNSDITNGQNELTSAGYGAGSTASQDFDADGDTLCLVLI